MQRPRATHTTIVPAKHELVRHLHVHDAAVQLMDVERVRVKVNRVHVEVVGAISIVYADHGHATDALDAHVRLSVDAFPAPQQFVGHTVRW